MEKRWEQSLSGGKSMTTKEILTQAVTAKNAINSADTETKNKALANMADAL